MTICSVMLIMLGTDLDPDAVTKALGLVPSQAWRRGENWKSALSDGSVRIGDGIYQWDGWKLWLPKETRRAMSLMDQINHWLEVLQGHSAEIKALKAQGFTIELNCYISAEVYTLYVPSKLQSQLSELGVDLEMDFFSARPMPKVKRRRPAN